MATPRKSVVRSADKGAAVFRDTRFTSRVLILPDGRPLPVVQGRVSAPVGDSVARDYLNKHPDLQLQE